VTLRSGDHARIVGLAVPSNSNSSRVIYFGHKDRQTLLRRRWNDIAVIWNFGARYSSGGLAVNARDRIEAKPVRNHHFASPHCAPVWQAWGRGAGAWAPLGDASL